MNRFLVRLETLKRHWGLDTFLNGGRESVDTIVAGRDSRVIFPSGGGTSLTYPLPALCTPGVAVVVSPHIARTIDPIERLRANGVAASTMNSTRDFAEGAATRRELRKGRLDLIDLVPERLLADDMVERLSSAGVAYRGIGVPDCIRDGEAAAVRVLDRCVEPPRSTEGAPPCPQPQKCACSALSHAHDHDEIEERLMRIGHVLDDVDMTSSRDEVVTRAVEAKYITPCHRAPGEARERSPRGGQGQAGGRRLRSGQRHGPAFARQSIGIEEKPLT